MKSVKLKINYSHCVHSRKLTYKPNKFYTFLSVPLLVVPFTTNLDREFVLTFPSNPADRNVKLLIQTPVQNQDVIVNIQTPRGVAPVVNRQEVVTSTNPRSVILPSSLRPTTGTGVNDKTVIVTSSAVITLTVLAEGSCSAFLSLPVDGAGTEYYGTAWWSVDVGSEGLSNILIAAAKSGTNISLTLPYNHGVSVEYKGETYVGGQTIREYLEKYQSFKLDGRFDLTGARIKAEEPIVVFSGNRKIKIGSNSLPDNTMEQLPPTSTWGNKFVILPVPNDRVGSFIKFVSKNANTTVAIHGYGYSVLDEPGDFASIELSADTLTMIESDNPIQVLYFTKGDHKRPATGAPSALLVPPVQQYLSVYSFKTITDRQKAYENVLLIAVKQKYVSGILLNDKPLPCIQWRKVPGSDYIGGHIKLNSDNNKLHHKNPDVQMMAYVYGFSINDCAYCFPAGMNLKTLEMVCTSLLFLPVIDHN